MSQSDVLGKAAVGGGFAFYSYGTRIIINNPWTDIRWAFYEGPIARAGGASPALSTFLTEGGVSFNSKMYPMAPGSTPGVKGTASVNIANHAAAIRQEVNNIRASRSVFGDIVTKKVSPGMTNAAGKPRNLDIGYQTRSFLYGATNNYVEVKTGYVDFKGNKGGTAAVQAKADVANLAKLNSQVSGIRKFGQGLRIGGVGLGVAGFGYDAYQTYGDINRKLSAGNMNGAGLSAAQFVGRQGGGLAFGAAGTLGGVAVGAALFGGAGAVSGSIVPGIGTLALGVAGGIMGGIAGAIFGEAAMQRLYKELVGSQMGPRITAPGKGAESGGINPASGPTPHPDDFERSSGAGGFDDRSWAYEPALFYGTDGYSPLNGPFGGMHIGSWWSMARDYGARGTPFGDTLTDPSRLPDVNVDAPDKLGSNTSHDIDTASAKPRVLDLGAPLLAAYGPGYWKLVLIGAAGNAALRNIASGLINSSLGSIGQPPSSFLVEVLGYGAASAASSPVLLDLSGQGINITQLLSSNTWFDTAGDGYQHRTAWAGAGSGVLVYDTNGDGKITQANQINFTLWDPTATSDMQALLDVFDTNHNGKLDAGDVNFLKFKVLVTNADGTQTLSSLSELGIVSINLIENAASITFPDGSSIDGKATFTRTDNTTGEAATVTLASDAQGYKINRSVIHNIDGSTTIDVKAVNPDGSLASETVTTTSADGKSRTLMFDDNADGVVDRIQTVDASTAANGAVKETVSNYRGASLPTAYLIDRTVTTTTSGVSVARDLSPVCSS
ncbi:hypothetical protein [Bradyrhizobium sp.]|uniref:hypothetical protein n=1 Tax=Bradyrhizobium sp. TaxID=376 RepID=UPI0040379E36